MRLKISKAFASFSLTEKVIFGIFAVALVISTAVILWNINNQFMTEVPVSGGTIQEGIVGYPRLINPLFTYTDAGNDLTSLIYSGLMKANPDGTLSPDLAKSYSVSKDGLTYSFILKNNLTFQDGTPLTTDDVEFTIQKATDPALKSPKAANWDGVVIDKISPTEIHFILKKPYSPFLENTTLGILPQHIWKDIDDDLWPISIFNQEPIGSGPYRIKTTSKNKSGLYQYYHLVPFAQYSLSRPYISNLIIRFYTSDQALIEAYKKGEIDTLDGITADEAQSLVKTGAHVLTTPLPRIFGIFFNQNQATVLVNKEVRQALNIAIDRTALINTVLDGYGIPATGAVPDLSTNIPANGLASSTADTASSTQDQLIAQARDILTKAGWKPDANGIMTKQIKNGKQTSTQVLRFSISTSDAPDLKQTASIVQNIWRQVGADVSVKVFNLSDLNQSVIRPRNYDALLFGTAIGRDMDLFAFWDSSQRNDPGLNIALYANPKVDKLLEDARATSDTAVRNNDYALFEKQ
ncbi:MAG: ABC transporter substrate-binding protein, partial [Candidatus Pacebacteria bacterium]|nr:ABC transporter substrate-binding protein [Candidatus Paceibacterota bacterium]